MESAQVYRGRGVSAALSSCADGIWEGSQPRDQSMWGSERKLISQLCIPLLASPTPAPSSSPGFSPESLENNCWFSLGTSAKFLSQFAQLPSKIIHRIFKFLTRSFYCLRRDYSHAGVPGESGPAEANTSRCVRSSCIFHSVPSLSILVLSSLREGASWSALGLGCALTVPVRPPLYLILLPVTLEAETVPGT